MKKIGILLGTLLLTIVTSCTEDEALINQDSNVTNRQLDNEPFVDYYPFEKMNWSGKLVRGYDGNLHKDCDRVPKGWCVGILSPMRIMKNEILNEDVIFISYEETGAIRFEYNYDHLSNGSQEIFQKLISGGATYEYASENAEYMATHFTFDERTEIDGEIRNQIIQETGIEPQSRIYIESGDYEIISNPDYPNGYFDVNFTIE